MTTIRLRPILDQAECDGQEDAVMVAAQPFVLVLPPFHTDVEIPGLIILPLSRGGGRHDCVDALHPCAWFVECRQQRLGPHLGWQTLIEQVSAAGSVKPLDEGILIRFARLDGLYHHIIVCAPLFERFTEKGGTIVCANDPGLARVALDLFKHPHQTR